MINRQNEARQAALNLRAAQMTLDLFEPIAGTPDATMLAVQSLMLGQLAWISVHKPSIARPFAAWCTIVLADTSAVCMAMNQIGSAR